MRQLDTAITQRETSVNPLFNSENLGITLVLVGILAIALAAWRYNQVFWQIERGDYRPNRLAIWVMTGVVMILGFLSIPLLLLREQSIPRPSSIFKQPQSQKLR